MADHRVVFTPSGLSGTVPDGMSVLDAARLLGADLDSVCGGRGVCGRCQVVASTGVFAKWAITSELAALTEPGSLELDYHGNRPLGSDHRLGCAASICGDVVIDVPAASQVHRQVIRKAFDVRTDVNGRRPALVVDPFVTLHYLELARAELGDEPASAGDQLLAALDAQHGIERATVSSAVLRRVHPALSAGRRENPAMEGTDVSVTVAVRDNLVIAIWPGYFDRIVGAAIDVGSTTIAGHLCDLTTGEVLASAGRMNPQIRFGEDLMSRVSYVMMNAGGATQLTAAVRGALDELVGELVLDGGSDRDAVMEVVIVGNPIMHHLVLGIDPTPLGQAPFVLATDRSVTGPAIELDLVAPFASFYLGPCIAGHVGADTAAAILTEGPHRSKHMQLLVDVGTNAEIVLGDEHRQFAASSPTGPAFEGAQISSGQRATAGAVERVRIDPATLDASVKVIGSDLWSDEAGFSEAIVSTGVTGVCGSGIIDAIAEMYLAGVIDHDGAIVGATAARSTRVVPDGRTFRYVLYVDDTTELSITQNDVRAVQLAKAALRAGIDLLVERAGSPELVDVRLAGAFGAHIDPLHALVLGLVPDCPLEGVRSVGNSAGTGAVQALLSRALRTEMEQAVRRVEKVETATEPSFQELFIAAMAFPHQRAPSPHLSQLVTLPERPAATAGRTGRRRARA